MPELTKEDRIKTVFGGGGHVVILGAGASIAATKRNPLQDGKILPSMDNFIDVVGLKDIVENLPKSFQEKNFENLYSKLSSDSSKLNVAKQIENRVYKFFKEMILPNEPTIYDYLVLALRPRDVIATFNWDPFLYQAWSRNRHVGDLPYICFLHGNVAIGYNEKANRFGPAGYTVKATNDYLEPTKLLYPVNQKNYNNDKFIKTQWDMLDSFLSEKVSKRLTIFGYGAPASDKEAVEILKTAWNMPGERNGEQFEIIDKRPENEIVKQWSNFISSGHYDYCTDYFESSLAYNPRRTFESYMQSFFPLSIEEAFSSSNPVPNNFSTLEELWDWHKPLIEAEKEYYKKE